MSNAKPNILLLISGSIAAYKALDLLSQLRKWGATTRVVLSAGAEQFVTPASVEALTGQPPHGRLFAPGDSMAHIDLAEWADLVLLYPASASTLGRLAAGLADDLIGCLSLARVRSTPFWLAPAMNPKMWSHPAVQDSVTRLGHWGYRLIEPGTGIMACGEHGPGRVAEPADVLAQIQAWQAGVGDDETPLRWLITGGGTREYIDSVRFLGNDSSGQTAAALARHCLDCGDHVTLLAAGQVACPPAHPRLRVERFVSHADLQALLQQELGRNACNAVAHAAAVSDYLIVDADPKRKLESQAGERWLRLKQSPKLLNHVRDWGGGGPLYLVGFKLLTAAKPDEIARAIARQQEAAHPDLIVFNDTVDLEAGHRRGQLWKDGSMIGPFTSRTDLAAQVRADALATIGGHNP